MAARGMPSAARLIVSIMFTINRAGSTNYRTCGYIGYEVTTRGESVATVGSPDCLRQCRDRGGLCQAVTYNSTDGDSCELYENYHLSITRGGASMVLQVMGHLLCDKSLDRFLKIGNIYYLTTNTTVPYNSCAVLQSETGFTGSGIFRLQITPALSVQVTCDFSTDGGGWTIFQRRQDGGENFQRGWDDYVAGFGSRDADYWIGLENLYQITSRAANELRVDLWDFETPVGYRFAVYGTFGITDSSTYYKLIAGEYSGTAGDAFNYLKGLRFSTYDNTWSDCASQYKGAWWYGGYGGKYCHNSNLNGLFLRGSTTQFATGTVWRDFRGHYYALKCEMKVRPKGWS